ncbi:hypothetical protein [Arthrobacter methylotrophus]|uniref:hypothetical protein n=1 Tax=Arthrobacter methylotrophus TaxID=121291 RepID=UPI003CD08497
MIRDQLRFAARASECDTCGSQFGPAPWPWRWPQRPRLRCLPAVPAMMPSSKSALSRASDCCAKRACELAS